MDSPDVENDLTAASISEMSRSRPWSKQLDPYKTGPKATHSVSGNGRQSHSHFSDSSLQEEQDIQNE